MVQEIKGHFLIYSMANLAKDDRRQGSHPNRFEHLSLPFEVEKSLLKCDVFNVGN